MPALQVDHVTPTSASLNSLFNGLCTCSAPDCILLPSTTAHPHIQPPAHHQATCMHHQRALQSCPLWHACDSLPPQPLRSHSSQSRTHQSTCLHHHRALRGRPLGHACNQPVKQLVRQRHLLQQLACRAVLQLGGCRLILQAMGKAVVKGVPVSLQAMGRAVVRVIPWAVVRVIPFSLQAMGKAVVRGNLLSQEGTYQFVRMAGINSPLDIFE